MLAAALLGAAAALPLCLSDASVHSCCVGLVCVCACFGVSCRVSFLCCGTVAKEYKLPTALHVKLVECCEGSCPHGMSHLLLRDCRWVFFVVLGCLKAYEGCHVAGTCSGVSGGDFVGTAGQSWLIFVVWSVLGESVLLATAAARRTWLACHNPRLTKRIAS